ncbi:GDPmannose 4,6-dehydratase [Methylobacterium phyllostachyos]|uniref:GDP-mannose 4,6-dehydratase n=1 Tax=Methylobacterium phyllostachyos TaxID=582672 RepID=A0A1H0I515_9HYPH|nr:GDP-mannose 4,6-dehydratase [Methylobacterium phyllostachyos]SDO26564.1 GDPmannose 4,6-dehydratase [Methylobacterium phyllostachyos]
MRTALITGVTGQDGTYLAENLLQRGYKVYATYRRSSSENFWRLEALNIRNHSNLVLLQHDMTDFGSTLRLLDRSSPDEIYNLAAQTHVQVSFEQPFTTAQITGLGPLGFLEAIRARKAETRYYQASSAEMFGLVQGTPQNETTPFYPRSPYGVSKLFAHWMTINYRESYDIFAASGILFNHESPLRGTEFVTRKITSSVARIVRGSGGVLRLGNLNAMRDWGYAKDYVEGMRLMLQADKPDTFVLATNKTTSVRDFVTLSFRAADVDLDWSGSGVDEFALSRQTGQRVVEVDPAFFRPAEVDTLIGDFTKARKTLGWFPSTDLHALCTLMVEADLRRLGNDSYR